MAEFHETGYGRKFLEHDFPELVRQLERIANVLEKLNKIAEDGHEELNNSNSK